MYLLYPKYSFMNLHYWDHSQKNIELQIQGSGVAAKLGQVNLSVMIDNTQCAMPISEQVNLSVMINNTQCAMPISGQVNLSVMIDNTQCAMPISDWSVVYCVNC